MIAALHADSWRRTYRGVFSDVYLDHEAPSERRRYWHRHLRTKPGAQQRVLVALDGGTCAGFICIVLDAEPAWGPLLDNLHVRQDYQSRGIGRRLVEAGRLWVRCRGPHDRWHLWVVESNQAARRIYEHLGWAPAERSIHHAPDGSEFPAWRYVQDIPAQ